MALLDIDWNPDKKQLRIFLLLLAVFSCIVAGIYYFRTGSQTVPPMIVAVGFSIAIVGLIIPPLARLVYVVWMAAAFPIGWTVSHLTMALVYYAVVTPFGLVMRIAGRDVLGRKFDPTAKTYGREHRPTEDISRYFRQF